jgi:hypothetical protein
MEELKKLLFRYRLIILSKPIVLERYDALIGDAEKQFGRPVASMLEECFTPSGKVREFMHEQYTFDLKSWEEVEHEFGVYFQ